MKSRLITMAFLMIMAGGVRAQASCPSRPYNFATGTIYAYQVNANENALYTALCNGGFTIPALMITNAMIATNANIADTKLACATSWSTLSNCSGAGAVNADALHTHAFTSVNHGDLSAATSTMHSALSVEISDDGSYFATDTVENALQDLAAWTSYSTSTTLGISKYVGYKYHETIPASATVTIPAGAATNGIKVVLGARLAADGSEICLPLNLDGVDLSANTPNEYPEFEISLSSSQINYIYVEKTIILNTTNVSGLDLSIEHTVTAGTAFLTAGASGSAQFYSIVVEVF